VSRNIDQTVMSSIIDRGPPSLHHMRFFQGKTFECFFKVMRQTQWTSETRRMEHLENQTWSNQVQPSMILIASVFLQYDLSNSLRIFNSSKYVWDPSQKTDHFFGGGCEKSIIGWVRSWSVGYVCFSCKKRKFRELFSDKKFLLFRKINFGKYSQKVTRDFL